MKHIIWEYKSDRGDEIERHNVLTLSYLFDREGLTVQEAQKVLFASAQEVVHVRLRGDFRRIT